MKKLYLLLCLSIFSLQGLIAQPLFTYGNNAVTKEEFLRAYNKNKSLVADKQKSVSEHLDLYVKFKLKVKAAQEMRLDTLPQLISDMQNFRSQVENGYLNDEKRVAALVDEALARTRKDIHLVHFFVAADSKMDNIDTGNAIKAMQEVAHQLSTGRKDYTTIADEITQKFITTRQSDMGFITALTLPYAIENLVYELKPGGYTTVYRNKSGWHIFVDVEERKSAGRWRVAQILMTTPPNATQQEISVIGRRADSVYNLLINGGNLIELAKEFSEDKNSYMNGGELPEFGTGKYEAAFENNVFTLKKDGEFSRPFLTSHGFHIVKRLEFHPTPEDKSDDAFLYGLKQRVLQDARIGSAKEAFLKEVLVKTGYKKDPAVKESDLFRYADSVAAIGEVKKYPISNKTLFSFAKSAVKGSDWLHFILDYKLNPDVYRGEDNTALWNKFISTSAFDYYRKHLEEYSNDFKYQMNEFREGNMLFEVMERNVWNKAAADTTGLKKMYEENKGKYLWSESANILLFNCIDSKLANQAIRELKAHKDWKKIAEENPDNMQVDSGRYEISQLQLPAGTAIHEGFISEPVVNNNDNTASFVCILQQYPANLQRSFEEARGLVINDYQAALDEKWIQQLKEKYPVKINEAVLKTIVN